MSEKQKIIAWSAPVWHEDFGSSDAELEKLKLICLAVMSLNLSYSFGLDCFEEGYLAVNFYKNETLVGSIQVVEKEKFGIFFEDSREIYIPFNDHDLDLVELKKIFA